MSYGKARMGSHCCAHVNRVRNAVPGLIHPSSNVIVVVTNTKTGAKKVTHTHNILTTEGANNYAERIVGIVAPSWTKFNDPRMYLATGRNVSNTPAIDDDYSDYIGPAFPVTPVGGYPKVNDTDTNNSGKGTFIVTWKFTWGAGVAVGTWTHAFIANGGAATGTDPLQVALQLSTSVTVGSSDTLDIFENHTIVAVP